MKMPLSIKSTIECAKNTMPFAADSIPLYSQRKQYGIFLISYVWYLPPYGQ